MREKGTRFDCAYALRTAAFTAGHPRGCGVPRASLARPGAPENTTKRGDFYSAVAAGESLGYGAPAARSGGLGVAFGDGALQAREPAFYT